MLWFSEESEFRESMGKRIIGLALDNGAETRLPLKPRIRFSSTKLTSETPH
jgi:hypothetical protein